jgi:hypothetical protein
MIHSNKSAPLHIPEKIIEFVYARQEHQCLFRLEGCTGTIQGKPHHWGLHNKGYNRRDYPSFVHHPANLAGLCLSCHRKRGSGDNLPDWVIRDVMDYLVLDKLITMSFFDMEFQLYAGGIFLYCGDRAGRQKAL